jgi:hypothetical protein
VLSLTTLIYPEMAIQENLTRQLSEEPLSSPP